MGSIVIKDKLIGAGIGAGVGLTLAYLSGANKIGVTLVFSALGGAIAYSLAEDSFSGASGRPSSAPQPPPQGGGA